MKIGVCGGIDRAEAIKRQGYDYIEENLAKITALSDSEFSERVRAYEKLDLPVYSFNSFFGPDNRIYDEDGLESVKAYAEKALYRAHAIGGSICVLGSGKQRNIAEGLDRGFAEQRFCDVLSLVGDIAEKNNIRIAIEPLNTNETNLINKVSEGADFARRAGKKSIGVLVDFFHLFMVFMKLFYCDLFSNATIFLFSKKFWNELTIRVDYITMTL